MIIRVLSTVILQRPLFPRWSEYGSQEACAWQHHQPQVTHWQAHCCGNARGTYISGQAGWSSSSVCYAEGIWNWVFKVLPPSWPESWLAAMLLCLTSTGSFSVSCNFQCSALLSYVWFLPCSLFGLWVVHQLSAYLHCNYVNIWAALGAGVHLCAINSYQSWYILCHHLHSL